MAITTTVTIDNTDGGFATLVSGLPSGNQSRQVSVQAVPAQGYKFERWEIVTSPVQLERFAVVASVPVSSVAEVCGTLANRSTYQDVARELFTDGTMLYIDTEGKTPAPTGYWGAGSGTYYYWAGGRLPQLQTCTYGSGGGSGTSGGDTSGGGGTGDGSVNIREDIRFT